VPFTGDRSGAFLRELMAEAGLSTDTNAFITNIVKCNPRDDRGNNRRPSSVECVRCRGFLAREIELLDPRVILLLGDLACREVLGKPIGTCVGREQRHLGRWVLPLYHPSYAASYPYPRERYRAEFLRVCLLIKDAERIADDAAGASYGLAEPLTNCR
jgi:DNA polymerase